MASETATDEDTHVATELGTETNDDVDDTEVDLPSETDAPDLAETPETPETNDAQDEVIPVCPDDCGPGAICQNGLCVCERADCTSDVTAIEGVSMVGVGVQDVGSGETAVPVLAYVRGSGERELTVARWTKDGVWTFSDVAADSTARPSIAARAGDAGEGGLVVALPGAASNMPLFWEDAGDWNSDDPGFGCSWGHVEQNPLKQPPTGPSTMLLGCVQGPGTLAFYDIVPDQAAYEPIGGEPLYVGKENVSKVRWTVKPNGRIVVAWVRLSETQYDVVVARSIENGWDTEVVATVAVPYGLAVAADGNGRVHVLYAFDDEGEAVLAQRVERGALDWDRGEIRRRTGKPDFGTNLWAARGPGNTIGVLWNEGDVLVWNEADITPTGEPTVLDESGWAFIYAAPTSTPRPVVVLQYFDRLATWLPRGP